MHYEVTVGTPKQRMPDPSGLGISTRRTGCGSYVQFSNSCFNCLISSSSFASKVSIVCPSLPDDPRFLFTSRHPSNSFFSVQSCSKRCLLSMDSVSLFISLCNLCLHFVDSHLHPVVMCTSHMNDANSFQLIS